MDNSPPSDPGGTLPAGCSQTGEHTGETDCFLQLPDEADFTRVPCYESEVVEPTWGRHVGFDEYTWDGYWFTYTCMIMDDYHDTDGYNLNVGVKDCGFGMNG
jgi:hypothetical protein